MLLRVRNAREWAMKPALLLLLPAVLSAVDEGPFPVLAVIDGSTIEIKRAGKPELVRLLFVATRDSENQSGKATPEGKAAKAFLTGMLPAGREVTLWGPLATLEKDADGHLLAVVTASKWFKYQITQEMGDGSQKVVATRYGPSVQEFLIGLGHSPYWRKHGDAMPGMHEAYLDAQRLAEYTKAGAWATAPHWIRDKAHERMAP